MSFFSRPLPPVLYPPNTSAINTRNTVGVPPVYPAYMVYDHHHNVLHVHYFPHTTSVENHVSHHHTHIPGHGPMMPSRRPFF